MTLDFDSLRRAIIDGDTSKAISLTEKTLEAGLDAQELVTRHLAPAMDEVGRLFEEGEFFMPELFLATRAMKGAMELIQPILASGRADPAGKVAIGSVRGDMHDIGKNLVVSMLEGGGFEVIDLGVDAPTERFVEAVRDEGAEIVALSSLVTTTMPSMGEVIEALVEADLRDRVKVMIGGAPITQPFADEIGADGYGESAVEAVKLARALLEG